MLPDTSQLPAIAGVLAISALQRGTKATGHTTTRWLLRGLLLLDAAAIAGSCDVSGSNYPLLAAAGVLALIVPNVVGAKLLFGKPRAPAAAGT